MGGDALINTIILSHICESKEIWVISEKIYKYNQLIVLQCIMFQFKPLIFTKHYNRILITNTNVWFLLYNIVISTVLIVSVFLWVINTLEISLYHYQINTINTKDEILYTFFSFQDWLFFKSLIMYKTMQDCQTMFLLMFVMSWSHFFWSINLLQDIKMFPLISHVYLKL